MDNQKNQLIDPNRARTYGFTEDEIEKMESYCQMEKLIGNYSTKPTLVEMPMNGIAWVCETVAKAIERVCFVGSLGKRNHKT